MGRGGILVYDMTERTKRNQLLVLETLNDLINQAAANNDKRRPVSVAAIITYSDGSTTSNVAGRLDRVQLTGLLIDLSNQVFFECKQREINDEIESTVNALYLASMPTSEKPN